MTEKSQPERMSTAERTELSKLVRARTRVRRNEIDAQKAVQLAKVEKQLAATYDKYDSAWAGLMKEIEGKLGELDEQIIATCRARGIPEQFRPSVSFGWYGRGENASRERRAELRRVAQTSVDARAKAAKVEVDRKEAELLGEIVLAGLASTDAKVFLEKLPTIEALMPQIELAELEEKVPLEHGRIM